MKVQLLGTGAADGWPQPFCRCSSCNHARSAGTARHRSGVLVDDVILLDPSPDVAAACARFGVALDQVSTILIGHAHHDHVDPSLLLAWCWERSRSRDDDLNAWRVPLTVIAPRSALELVQPWIDRQFLASGAIELVEVTIGADTPLPSGHRVRALPAEHGLGANGWPREEVPNDAVLWEVTSPQGDVVVHAADTAPLPPSTVAMLRPIDLLLLEETFGDVTDHGTAHLDLATFPALLADLRTCGAVTETTQVVAVHLSHFNPPEPQLRDRLAAWGARPGCDGEVITLPPAMGARERSSRRPVLRTLVTGGARSGKSREAERLLAAHPNVTYVATASHAPDDHEWAARVQRHRERRPQSWQTIESDDIAAVLRAATDDQAILVDCLTLWLTRVIDDVDGWQHHDRARDAVALRTSEVLAALRECRAQVVIVTNEVGWGIVPVDSGTRLFRDLLGEVNAHVASVCDEVLLVVAGQVLPLRSTHTMMGERNSS